MKLLSEIKFLALKFYLRVQMWKAKRKLQSNRVAMDRPFSALLKQYKVSNLEEVKPPTALWENTVTFKRWMKGTIDGKLWYDNLCDDQLTMNEMMNDGWKFSAYRGQNVLDTFTGER
jgi:hypothetical protein